MKCLTLFTCIIAGAVAASPIAAQVTPPVAPTPPTPRAEPAPRPSRAPRAGDVLEWRDDDRLRMNLDRQQRELQDLTVERQRELEERQRELQDQQVERQRELEDRQRERMDAQIERQREMEERVRDRLLDRDMTPPAALPFELAQPTAIAPLPPLAPRLSSDETMVPESLDGAFLNRRPPAPWAQGDPADSLYRVAREALNRGDYRRAAQLFNDLTRRYPSSAYAYVSTYYEAFSRFALARPRS